VRYDRYPDIAGEFSDFEHAGGEHLCGWDVFVQRPDFANGGHLHGYPDEYRGLRQCGDSHVERWYAGDRLGFSRHLCSGKLFVLRQESDGDGHIR